MPAGLNRWPPACRRVATASRCGCVTWCRPNACWPMCRCPGCRRRCGNTARWACPSRRCRWPRFCWAAATCRPTIWTRWCRVGWPPCGCAGPTRCWWTTPPPRCWPRASPACRRPASAWAFGCHRRKAPSPPSAIGSRWPRGAWHRPSSGCWPVSTACCNATAQRRCPRCGTCLAATCRCCAVGPRLTTTLAHPLRRCSGWAPTSCPMPAWRRSGPPVR